MRRWLAFLIVLTVGCSTSQAQNRIPPTKSTSTNGPSPSTTEPRADALGAGGDGATSTSAATPTSTTVAEPEGPIVIVMPDGLPEDFLDRIDTVGDVGEAALIRSGPLRLVESRDAAGDIVDRPADGFVIPIEALLFDVASSAEIFSPDLADALQAIGPNEALLSESSAALRRLGVGGAMTFDDGATYRVASIVPDGVAGTTEVILVGADPPSITERRRRAAIIDFDGTEAELERALSRLYPDDALRVFDRRGEARRDRQRVTLPQIVVKEIFGEFAYRPRSGGAIDIDPAWTEANLVTVQIPLLGQIKCHRIFAAILEDVMTGLVADGLDDVIDPGAYEGCWNPRFIAGSTRLSRHAWGIAADINFGNALDGGPGSPVHQELLDRTDEAGLTSGHLWSVPDPGHFEYVSPDGGAGTQ